MVETTRPPALPSTADSQPYIPISWPAVAAFTAAILFILTLLGFAYDAYTKHRPLLEPLLVGSFVAVIVILSFICRRVIRNSEGTRTGSVLVGKETSINLPNAAWWTAIVLGLVYIAYYLTVEYSVKREARGEVEKLISSLSRDDVPAAFHQTLMPNRRVSIAPADGKRMENEFREPYIAFRQTRLARTVLRNKGECEFEGGGLKNWVYGDDGLVCSYSGVLKCPEGRIHITVPLRGSEKVSSGDVEKISTGREWQILPTTKGYVDSSTLTPYGWAINTLIAQGESVARSFMRLQNAGPAAQLAAFAIYVEGREDAADAAFAPLAALGGWGLRYSFPPGFLDQLSDRLFTLENGAMPSETDRNRYRRMWRTVGILLPGARIPESPDMGETLTRVENGVELRLPVELPMPTSTGDASAARGRLVLACTSPELVARLKDLKASANPDKTSEKAPEDLALPALQWKVLRVESNLKVVPVAKAQGGKPGM